MERNPLIPHFTGASPHRSRCSLRGTLTTAHSPVHNVHVLHARTYRAQAAVPKGNLPPKLTPLQPLSGEGSRRQSSVGLDNLNNIEFNEVGSRHGGSKHGSRYGSRRGSTLDVASAHSNNSNQVSGSGSRSKAVSRTASRTASRRSSTLSTTGGPNPIKPGIKPLIETAPELEVCARAAHCHLACRPQSPLAAPSPPPPPPRGPGSAADRGALRGRGADSVHRGP